MNKKEGIKYFNQHFTIILSKILANFSLNKEVVIEYYTFALHASIAMLVKRASKNTLVENLKKLRMWKRICWA